MSPDAKTDAARSPTFADGMSNGQTRMIGTMHQPTRAPTRPRSRYRRSGATTAQPYATRIARESQPRFFIDHDLAPSTTVSGAIIVTDLVPDHNRSPRHHRRGRTRGIGRQLEGPGHHSSSRHFIPAWPGPGFARAGSSWPADRQLNQKLEVFRPVRERPTDPG